jgi:exosortase D (VPLPA-CTERM-specific)
MMEMSNDNPVVWRFPLSFWVSVIVICAIAGAIFYDGLEWMVMFWVGKEEYSHGFMIPAITLFLIWQKKDTLERMAFDGSWAGFAVVLGGIAIFILGELSTLYIIIQYSFIVVLMGLALSAVGWRGIREIWIPLSLLVFMIPLPSFLFQELSAQLQLVSSQLGVAFIRLFGISVYLEGNVIDLGSYKLQVVEACSGLRYLFPLASLAFISAYFFKTSFWKRCVVFLSSIPITIFMNSFRIGAIGVLVEYWGIAAAEGFLHDFEGWVIFMSCTAVLVGEMWLLARFGEGGRPLREIFGLDFPEPTPKNAVAHHRLLPRPFMGAAVALAATAVFVSFLGQRIEIAPERKTFMDFPMTIESWQGKRGELEHIYVDALKFDDYILADFTDDGRRKVSFYVAYYASQRKGESAHSPRTCIPGGGWQIKELSQVPIDGVHWGGKPFLVNRVVIRKGEYTQLVYYWFQQRGRNLTNEYLVKWYLFWDALTRNRTDGALVRLTTLITPNESLTQVEGRLHEFAQLVLSPLGEYVPE